MAHPGTDLISRRHRSASPSRARGLLDKLPRPPTVADPNAGLRTLASRLGEELCSLVDASDCLGEATSDSV